MLKYDLAIVGSGSAGFAAAIAATAGGLKVVMVERATTGGTCVNVGCIPSKALVAAAEARQVIADRRFPGIGGTASPTDMAALIAGKRELVEGLRREKYENLVTDYGWRLVTGAARFVTGPALVVGSERIEADRFLVATGSSPWVPDVPGLAESGYLTSTTAMDLERLPQSLIVVGGNYVGLELGQTFARLGSEVTLVEALPQLAPYEEPEIGAALAETLADEGISVRVGVSLKEVSSHKGGVVATVGDEAFRAEVILMATGRRPNVRDWAWMRLECWSKETARSRLIAPL